MDSKTLFKRRYAILIALFSLPHVGYCEDVPVIPPIVIPIAPAAPLAPVAPMPNQQRITLARIRRKIRRNLGQLGVSLQNLFLHYKKQILYSLGAGLGLLGGGLAAWLIAKYRTQGPAFKLTPFPSDAPQGITPLNFQPRYTFVDPVVPWGVR